MPICSLSSKRARRPPREPLSASILCAACRSVDAPALVDPHIVSHRADMDTREWWMVSLRSDIRRAILRQSSKSPKVNNRSDHRASHGRRPAGHRRADPGLLAGQTLRRNISVQGQIHAGHSFACASVGNELAVNRSAVKYEGCLSSRGNFRSPLCMSQES